MEEWEHRCNTQFFGSTLVLLMTPRLALEFPLLHGQVIHDLVIIESKIVKMLVAKRRLSR